MTGNKFTLDQDWMDSVLSDVETGLTKMANTVKTVARKNAPRSKRDQYTPVRAVVAATTRTIPEDIDVTDYVVRSMKAQQSETGGSKGMAITAEDFASPRAPTTITGRDLGKNRPMRVGPNDVLPIEGRVTGKRGEEIPYPLEAAEITKATKRAPSRLVTGRHLQDSIDYHIVHNGSYEISAIIVADRPYAWYVEHGIAGKHRTKDTSKTGFMRKGLAAIEDDVTSGKILKG